jgi:hypothetical protein
MLSRVARDRRQRPAGLGVVFAIAALLVGGVLLTGCDTSVMRTPRMSESWSKGLPLGLASLSNRVALAVDEMGGVYAVWGGLDRELRFVRLDPRARVEVDRALDVEANRPQQPQLTLDSEGQLHLVWLDKQDTGFGVMYARLSGEGQVLQGPTSLSESVLGLGYVVLALEPAGRTVEVFWSDTAASRPGLYHAAVDWTGAVVAPEEMLVLDGLGPAAQTDRQGFVHLAWRTERVGERLEFYYSVYDPARRALGPEMKVGEPVAQASLLGGPTSAAKFDGPRMGLDENLVYLAWTMEVRERGNLAAFTFYQAFSPPVLGQRGGPGPFDYPLPEVTAEPVFVWGADPSLTGDAQFLPGQQPGQVLACFTQAQGPRNLQMLQSAVNRLQAGQLAGLEVVSATTGASMKPNVGVDGQGHLHLVWIDTAGFDRYQVLYASTAPQVQEVLNPVTAGEVIDQVLELSFGAVTLIGFLPLYLMWAMPAFLVLLGFFLATQEVDLDQPRAATALWVVIGIHAIVKLMTAGGALERLSSGVLLATPLLSFVARWIVPLLITGLAVLVMGLYRRRSGSLSIFSNFFVFVLADSILFSLLFLTPLLLFG